MFRMGLMKRAVPRRAFDWNKLKERLDGKAKEEVMRMERYLTGIKSQIESVPKEVEPIDWAHYEKALPDTPFVGNCKKFMSELTAPGDGEMPALKQVPGYQPVPKEIFDVKSLADETFVEVRDEAKWLKEYLDARIVALEAEREKLVAERTNPTTSIEEFLEREPEVAAIIEKEIANEEWNCDEVGEMPASVVAAKDDGEHELTARRKAFSEKINTRLAELEKRQEQLTVGLMGK